MNKFFSGFLLALLSLGLSACDYMPEWMGGDDPEITRLSGKRLTVLPVARELNADPSLKKIPADLPKPVENSQWAQHSAGLTSLNGNLSISGDLSRDNSASVGDGADFEHGFVPQPIVVDNKVFTMDGEGRIAAHDAANIDNKYWISDGVSEEDDPGVNGGGLAYDAGKIYAVSGRGVIVSMDAETGNILWRKSGYSPFRSAPTVKDDKIFALTIGSELIAFDTGSGEPLWSHSGIDETTGLMISISPVIADGSIIVPYTSGELYALSPIDGREIWRNSLAMGKRTQASAILSSIGGDPVVDGRVVYAVSSGGVVMVYDVSFGQPIWTRAVASLNTPWVSGDYLFVLTADNTLVAFLKYDGRIRWSTKLASFEDGNKSKPITWRGPVMVGGALAIVGSHGEMVLVSASNGKMGLTIDVPDEIYTAPVVAGGRLYLVTKNAELYSLQ